MSNIVKQDEDIKYQGKIVEVVEQRVIIDGKEKIFEYARRSPGTRLIILTPNQRILMTREYRHEFDDYDYRLPGGKVFDALDEYNGFLATGRDILPKAEEAAKKEALEEIGIEAKNLKHFATSKIGATVVWDLYYFIVNDYEELKSRRLELGEDIEIVKIGLDEAKKLCLDGSMQEDRSVAVLLRFLYGLAQD